MSQLRSARCWGWMLVCVLFVVAIGRALRSFEGGVSPAFGAETILEFAVPLRDSSRAGRSPVITIYSDYACGACKRLDSVIAANPWIEREYTVVHRHNPIIGGDASRRVSRFSVCVLGSQSRAADRLVLYAGASKSQRTVMDSVLGAVRDSTSRAAAVRCIEADSSEDRIADHQRMASRLGLSTTPGIVVDSLLFRGLPPDFDQRLTHLLRTR